MGSFLGVLSSQRTGSDMLDAYVMENFLLKYPLIGHQIFDQLDNKNIAKCRWVSRPWYTFLDKEKLVWIRKLEKYNGNHNQRFKEHWKLAVKNSPVEIVIQWVVAVEQFYTFRPKRLEFQHSPLHIAAERGNLLLFKSIHNKTGLINPKRFDGFTPLKFASQEGHLEICKYIIEKVENKNPALKKLLRVPKTKIQHLTMDAPPFI